MGFFFGALESWLEDGEDPRAQVLVRIGLWSLPLILLVAAVHGVTMAPRFPFALAATVVVVVASFTVSVFCLRRVELKRVAALLVGVVLTSIALISLAHGGLSFPVVIWALLAPLAIPVADDWRRFFRVTLAGTVVMLVGLFVIDLMGAPGSSLPISPRGSLLVNAATWFALFFLFRQVSRTSGSVTDDHLAERDRYQRALLQSQKLSSLGHLADDLVHSFNDVLRSMAETLWGLGARIGAADPGHEEIADLEQALERARGLEQRLARYGASEPGVVPLLDVDKALSGLERIARRVVDVGVKVRFELDADGAEVGLEPGNIDQILINLLVNASDAIAGAGTIVVRSYQEGENVLVEVEDDGPGIADEVVPKLFEPFFTTKPEGIGSGLGLWSARTTAREVGGELELETSPRGTTVRLRLPLVSGDVCRSQPLVPIARVTAHEKRHEPSLLEHFDWFVGSIAEPRARTFGAVLVALCWVGGLLWAGFASWYWLGFNAPGVARTLAIAGVVTLLVPFVLRLTGSTRVCLVVLGVVLLAGLTDVMLARGGFPLEVLIWLLIIPLVGNLLGEYKQFVAVLTTVCLLYVGVLFVVAVAGYAPAPVVILTPREVLIESLVLCLAALGLFLVGTRAGHAVDQRLVAERDEFRSALLHSQRFETLGTFASSIAHDLNNALMVLLMSTESLAVSMRGGDGRREIAELNAACSRIRTIAQQLVRFGRADGGDEVAVVDEVLADLEVMMVPLLSETVRIERRLGAGDASVELSARTLDQLLLNLVLNARDAMAEEGGVVSVRTREDGKFVIIDVSDSGRGIDPSILGDVFSPYFTTDEGRMGLGLWLSRSVVTDVGGSLEVASTSSDGTTMRLKLPIAGLTWNRRISHRITAITVPRRETRETRPLTPA